MVALLSGSGDFVDVVDHRRPRGPRPLHHRHAGLRQDRRHEPVLRLRGPGRARARHRAGGAGRAAGRARGAAHRHRLRRRRATPSPASGVRALLAAKGRGRDMPVPVLVGSPRTLDGLAATLTQQVRDLVEAFWPGPLTLICREAPVARLGPGRHGRHGRGPDAAAPGGHRAAAGRRSDGRLLRQRLGPAAGHDPRRGCRAARRRRRRLPRRRSVRRRRGRRRSSTSPDRSRSSSAPASSTPTRSVPWRRRSWPRNDLPRPPRLHRQHLPLTDGRAAHALRARPRVSGDVRPGRPRRRRHLPTGTSVRGSTLRPGGCSPSWASTPRSSGRRGSGAPPSSTPTWSSVPRVSTCGRSCGWCRRLVGAPSR